MASLHRLCPPKQAFDPVAGEDSAINQQRVAFTKHGGDTPQPREAPLPLPLSFPSSPPSVARLHFLSGDPGRADIDKESVRRVYADLRQQGRGARAVGGGGGGGGGCGDGGGGDGGGGGGGGRGAAEQENTGVHCRQTSAELHEAGKMKTNASTPAGSLFAKACLQPFRGHSHSSPPTNGLGPLGVDDEVPLTSKGGRNNEGTRHGGPPPAFPTEVAIPTSSARAGNVRGLNTTTTTTATATATPASPAAFRTQHILSGGEKATPHTEFVFSKGKTTHGDVKMDTSEDTITAKVDIEVDGHIYCARPAATTNQAYVAAAAAAVGVQPVIFGGRVGGRDDDIVPAVEPQAAKLSVGLGSWADQAAAVGRLVDEDSRRVADERIQEAKKQQGLKRVLEQEMGSAVRSLPLSFLKDKGYKREAQREGLERMTRVVDGVLSSARLRAWRR